MLIFAPAKGHGMPFTTVCGLKGKVYVPGPPKDGTRKHSCKDCYSCQLCSDDRCRVCLSQKSCRCEKPTKKQFKSKLSDGRGRRTSNFENKKAPF